MKLTPRFTLAFILFAAALLTGVGLLAYNSGRDSLRAATISELQSTALEKESALASWVEDKETDIVTLTHNPLLIEASVALMTTPPGTAAYDQSRSAFLENVQPYLTSGKFLEVSLLDAQTGEVITSTDPSEEGKFREDREYFLEGKNQPFVQNPYYSISLQTIVMSAAAPLSNPDDGKLLGVLAARLDLEDMNEIILRRTGLHETDDSYLVNLSSLFVTQPRFISDSAVLLRGNSTEHVRRCLQKQSGVIDSVDYRDILTIVVYHWLPDRDLCLIVKRDETEAYAPARAFGVTILLISTAALLVAAVIANVLAHGLTRPIQELQMGAARFARGELDTKLNETSGDELGQLAAEFNKMAAALTEQQTHMRRRAEQFFNLTLDLLCTLYPSGQLVDINPAWETTLGYDRSELQGQLLETLIHPDDLYMTRKALQQVTKELKAQHFESRCRHKDGHYLWLAFSVTVSTQDKLLYVAGRDVTERHLTEAALRQQTEELERSNRELEQFGYVASHDLQEPLRLVSNYVQLLSRRYQGKLDEQANEYIGYAVEETNRMKVLMSDLLAYSRIGTQPKEFTPVDMEHVLENTLQGLQLSIQAANGIVTYDPLPAVLGSSAELGLLLHNLIDNALKFCNAGPPRIHLGVNPLNDRWLFFVRDNGIGIDPLHTERIFAIFQRLHSQEEYAGTGIGLAICRKIVERHGGRIWVDSEPGNGSTFYFTLQPAAGWSPEPVPAKVVKPTRDAIADRASDLI